MSSWTPVGPVRQEIFQLFASKEGVAEWIMNHMSSHSRKALHSREGLWGLQRVPAIVKTDWSPAAYQSQPPLEKPQETTQGGEQDKF